MTQDCHLMCAKDIQLKITLLTAVEIVADFVSAKKFAKMLHKASQFCFG